tara:strand:- start:425 stop:853 length:429 start_codon:yes stop_codon:yes gene_type:complete
MLGRHKTFNILVTAIAIVLLGCNGGGVRVSNNIEEYALEYIYTHDILEPDEIILAYYDYTISLNGTQAAIITNKRLIYHNEQTKTVSFNLKEITKINHYEKSIEGLFIEVWKGEELMVINIAPWNYSDIFLNVLKHKTSIKD